jgi:hypothetical protein
MTSSLVNAAFAMPACIAIEITVRDVETHSQQLLRSLPSTSSIREGPAEGESPPPTQFLYR